MRLRVVFVIALLLAAAAPAAAQPEAEVESRPLAIGINAGVGTQFGILTVSRSWQLIHGLSVEVGLGLGSNGVKALVFPKVEKQLSAHGWVTLGAGLALGQHKWVEQNGWCWDDSCAAKATSSGASATTAATIEYRGSSGWQFGPYLGAELLLNPGSMECGGGDEAIEHCERDHVDDGEHRVFTGFRFARAF